MGVVLVIPGVERARTLALRETTLPLSEVFGPTFQGEGPHAGRRCGFVRLGLCNLACEWCDTPYTWDTTRYDVAKECPDTTIDEIAARVDALRVPMVVLSGGEPLIHHRKLPRLLSGGSYEWHIETNGTIPPPGWLVQLVTHTTVSPKVATNDSEHRRIKPKALHAWRELAVDGRAVFKFVVRNEVDLIAVDTLVDTYRIPRNTVWIMPEGTQPGPIIQRHRLLAPFILDRGYHTTTRLHSLLWSDERGH